MYIIHKRTVLCRYTVNTLNAQSIHTAQTTAALSPFHSVSSSLLSILSLLCVVVVIVVVVHLYNRFALVLAVGFMRLRRERNHGYPDKLAEARRDRDQDCVFVDSLHTFIYIKQRCCRDYPESCTATAGRSYCCRQHECPPSIMWLSKTNHSLNARIPTHPTVTHANV